MLPFAPTTASKSHKVEAEVTPPSYAALISWYAEPLTDSVLAMKLS
jgi:hypothetical protein